jgi:hypothetical protein
MILFLALIPASALGSLAPLPKPDRGKHPEPTQEPQNDAATPAKSAEPDAPKPKKADQKNKRSAPPEQSSRILWIAPNFGAVTAGVQFKPMTAKEKFKLATNDTFDYTGFVWTGILAGQSMAMRNYPEFGDGMAAYGNYYWHEFVDGASGTYFTEAIVPVLTHQDPRYFTLGRGGFLKRLGYALSRTVVTKTDSGRNAFNWSELGGNGAEAALANLYYPAQERGVSSTMINWGEQMESAALNNVAKEFWPDFRHDILRQK